MIIIIPGASMAGMSSLLLLGTILHTIPVSLVSAAGYMSTLATMWGSTTPQDSYAYCYLQRRSLTPVCQGTFPIANNTTPPNVSLWSLSGGGYFACGLEYTSRRPVCWGQTPGSNITAEFRTVSYSDINAGGWHACGLRSGTGQVDCWGLSLSSVPPQAAVSFRRVVSGDQYSCALSRSTSKVICWGEMTSGSSVIPDPQAEFDDIYGGRLHVCGIEKGTRRTLCWGDNGNKQSQPPEDVKFLVLSAGLRHTCGIREDTREAVCWGDNSQAQQEVPKGVRFSVIAAGDWYTCGVELKSQEVICWGSYFLNRASVKTNQFGVGGLCVNNCESESYEDVEAGTNQCPGSDDKVCLRCSRCTNGSVEVSSCSGTNDRTCGLPTIPPPPPVESSKKSSSTAAIAGASTAGAVVLVILGLGAVCYFKARPGHGYASVSVNRICHFSSAELRRATENYNREMVLGRGAFGVVYKGRLADNKLVAIKKPTDEARLKASSNKELELLARVHHMYLVNLVGYCNEDGSLVFEYMENGSLFDCMFKKPNVRLNLVTRMRIAAQAARGLEYLHTYASPQIIHRDIKSANILLDEKWNAHVSDFGLSLFGPSGATHISNLTVVGTPGYVDPEYYQSGQLTSKSDVYSFGVVLLELLTGRRAVSQDESMPGLAGWVNKLMDESRPLGDIVQLDNSFPHDQERSKTISEALEQVLKLALDCTSMRGCDRPSMVVVANVLEDILKTFEAGDAMPSSGTSSSGAGDGGFSSYDRLVAR